MSRRIWAADWRLRGYQAWEHGQPLRGLALLAASTTLAPEVLVRRWLPGRREKGLPITESWSAFTGLHADKTAGPVFVIFLNVQPHHRLLYFDGTAVLPGLPRPLNLEVLVAGHMVHHEHLARGCNFSITIPVANLGAGSHEFRVLSSSWIVLDDHLGNADHRPLSFRLRRLLLAE